MLIGEDPTTDPFGVTPSDVEAVGRPVGNSKVMVKTKNPAGDIRYAIQDETSLRPVENYALSVAELRRGFNLH